MVVGTSTQTTKEKEKNMRHWLQSLSENGFDVFMVVYLAVLFLAYHYLLRWYIDIRLKKVEEQLEVLNETINESLDEMLS